MTILPSAIRGHGYRQEAIDLQPGGATITVTVPSDNPYEMGDDVEIVTQMSGGIAGPDPKMRSRRIAAKGMRQVRPAQRIHAGFLPGMGEDLEGDEVEVGLFGAVRKPRGNPKARRQARPKQYLVQATPVHAGFLPGMGADPNDVEDDELGAEVAAGKRQKVLPAFRPSREVLARGKALFAPRFDQVAGLGADDLDFRAIEAYNKFDSDRALPITDGKKAYWKAQVVSWDAAKSPASGASNWGSNFAAALNPLAATAGSITKGASDLAAARRSGGPESVTYQTNVEAPAARSDSKLPWIATGVGALVAVGVLAFILTRKKA